MKKILSLVVISTALSTGTLGCGNQLNPKTANIGQSVVSGAGVPIVSTTPPPPATPVSPTVNPTPTPAPDPSIYGIWENAPNSDTILSTLSIQPGSLEYYAVCDNMESDPTHATYTTPGATAAVTISGDTVTLSQNLSVSISQPFICTSGIDAGVYYLQLSADKQSATLLSGGPGGAPITSVGTFFRQAPLD